MSGRGWGGGGYLGGAALGFSFLFLLAGGISPGILPILAVAAPGANSINSDGA